MAGDDLEAPNVETLRRIRSLQASGRPVDLAVFPGTDHGILEFDDSSGERVMLRHAEGYFPLVADWIAGAGVQQGYGRALLEPAKSTAGRVSTEAAAPAGAQQR